MSVEDWRVIDRTQTGRGPIVRYVQTVVGSYCSDPRCAFCGREFYKWLAGRMLQMDRIEEVTHGSVEIRMTSFSDAAATSIKPPR